MFDGHDFDERNHGIFHRGIPEFEHAPDDVFVGCSEALILHVVEKEHNLFPCDGAWPMIPTAIKAIGDALKGPQNRAEEGSKYPKGEDQHADDPVGMVLEDDLGHHFPKGQGERNHTKGRQGPR